MNVNYKAELILRSYKHALAKEDRGKKKIKDYSLYLVISEEYGRGRNAFEIAESAIKGGVDVIQMREKQKGRPEVVDLGKRLCRLCKDNGAIFIVNDDPLLAKEMDADGVHLGQEDAKKCSLQETRKILGKDKIIGISTHSLEQFKQANEQDFDYIAFGPIFPTKTKDYFLETGDIKRVSDMAKKSVFFIGGINMSNIDNILKKGAKNVAMTRGITEAEDIVSAVRVFKNKLKKERGRRNVR